MALKIFTVLALCLAMTASGWTATIVDMQLIRAAFFSDACRQHAEALGIARTSDANALLAAFAGLQRRPASSPTAGAQRDDRSVPAVAVINLLRLNGIDAELVSATMAKEAAPADQVERVLVYVPTLARYFDPALPLEEQSLVDLVRERAERKHVLGPTLGADARDPCPSTCMHVYTAAGNATPPVRVKTETIRGR